MLAIVPMRCMSIAVGSSTSAERCNRMPTWRCSRTACCAAAIDFGRPKVIGSIRPGNSTVLRTGTMISASAGNGGKAPPPVPSFAITSATSSPHFLQCNHQTTGGSGAAYRAVAAGRQPQPAVEPPLWQFEPMDDGRAQFRRQDTGSRDHEIAVLDHGFGGVWGGAAGGSPG